MPIADTKPIKKSALSIRLTESAVYLRTDGPSGRPHRNAETRSSVVRGLLVLELAKPTKIESVELELVATAATAWPEGVGARRVEVSEQHQVFHARTVYFKADASVSSRRATSIGPGTSLNLDDPTLDWDLDDLEAGQIPGDARLPDAGPPFNGWNSQIPPTDPYPRSRGGPRQVSVDSHIYHRLPPVSQSISHHDDYDIPPYSPVDPASPSLVSPSTSLRSPSTSTAQALERSPHHRPTLEELRSELNSSLQNYSPSRGSSASAVSLRSLSLSRRQSVNMDVLVEDEDQASPPTQLIPPARSGSSLSRVHEERPETPSPQGSAAPSISTSSSAPSDPLGTSPVPAPQPFHGASTSSPRPSVSSPQPEALSSPLAQRTSSVSVERRGRNRSRFSLTAVADAFREAVRSTSPIAHRFASKPSKECGGEGSLARGALDRERSRDELFRAGSRGRTMDRGVSFELDEAAAGPSSDSSGRPWEPTVFALPGTHRTTPRLRDPIPRIFNGPHEVKERHEQKKTNGHGWKEFKKGTYTYPISFSIPSTSPPSLQADYGSVVWKLLAHVHRPGAFKSKYTATREVTVVACPTEEDTEESENIIVERHWDGQLQYLISVSGRCFWIGGVVPVTFAFMPLMKIKLHRLSVWVEEKVDYYSNMRRVVRSDTTQRFLLLSAKHEGKHPPSILPIESDDPDALIHSPLNQLFDPADDLGEMASSLMGPGPWTFHKDLKLPESCTKMHFTNKNRRANITVSHMLKVVIRIERGDDQFVDKAGKRKLFDIVVQTPVHILSCRCNPDWASLPRYEETFTSGTDIVVPNCPCQVGDIAKGKGLATPTLNDPPLASASGAHGSDIHLGSFHAHLSIPAPLERMMSHTSNDGGVSHTQVQLKEQHAHRGHHHPQSQASSSSQHYAYDPSPRLHHSSSDPIHPPSFYHNSTSPSPVRTRTDSQGRHLSQDLSHSSHPAIPVHAHETSPLDHSMRSLRSLPSTERESREAREARETREQTELLRAGASQFGRLVAGFEGEYNGEAPPEYAVAVAEGSVGQTGYYGGSTVGAGMVGGDAGEERGRQRGRTIQVN